MRRKLLEALARAVRDERSVVLATDLADGDQTLVFPFDDRDDPDPQDDRDDQDDPDAPATQNRPQLLAAAREAALADASGTVEVGGREIFLRVYSPRLRLVVVGAVHVAQPLAVMAATAGFRVTVVDPRDAFATSERFPGVELVRSWPAEALAGLEPDRRTAVVSLTHDPKLDDPALAEALRSPAFYVGALGSRRTHARRRERLARQGFGEEALDRIHGPVGLDIGARTPAEIAVAIVAEVVATLRSDGAGEP